jgi:protein TonB
LEHYKTQVLLLHSQQGMLDALSSGFSDRYSVHCATSGTEALNTLTETPIHIIVSAQDLPGMSGIDAIREAKKRSPDTVGILLASDSQDSTLEAVVGDLEIFQIVRGDVKPASLRKIIEQAARKGRMLALSESANDQAANVDMPAEEHIVMETSSTGLPMISEGSGPLPALKLHTGRNTPVAGSDRVGVLVLTKDEEFFATIRESARGLHDVYHALTPTQTENVLHKKKVGVMVTDAAMMGKNVDALTQRLRAIEPRLVAVVAGRRDDGDMLMDLINRGRVYRFLLKPVSPGRARLAIEASAKHHLDAPESAFKTTTQLDTNATAARLKLKSPKKQAAGNRKGDAKIAPGKTNAGMRTTTASMKATVGGLDDTPFKEPKFTDTIAGLKTTMGRTINVTKATISAQRSDGLDAALAGDSSARDRGFFRRKSVLAGIAAALAAGTYITWSMSGQVANESRIATPAADTAAIATPAIAEQELVLPASGTGAMTPPPYLALLEDARVARDSGNIAAPPGSNAIELYSAALAQSGNDADIAAEFDGLLITVFGSVEAALLETRLDDAEAALAALGIAVPDNPRLAFLDVQFNRERFRNTTDQARQAIRSGRFDLPQADERALNLLVDQLETARSEQRVDEVLALASERVEDGSLTSPSNDNARYYFELALNNDPGNAVAEQGLLVVASKLVLLARAAIDNGQLDRAAAYLADAQVLDPASKGLGETQNALETARREQAEREAAAAEEEAQRRAAAAALTEAPDEAQSALLAAAAAASATLDSDSSADGVFAGSTQQDGGDTAAASAQPELIGISSLKRTKYVAPKYPRNAMRRNITGSVDVRFTVAADGTVSAVEVIESTPGSVFDEAAKDAVAKWLFEPVLEDGVAVEKRSAVRMAFDLQ